MVRKKKINSIKVILLFHNKTGQSTGQLPTSFVKKTGDYSNTKSNYVALCRQRKAGCFDAEGSIEFYIRIQQLQLMPMLGLKKS